MKENGRRYEKNSQCCSYDYNYYLVTKGEHKPNFREITMRISFTRGIYLQPNVGSYLHNRELHLY